MLVLEKKVISFKIFVVLLILVMGIASSGGRTSGLPFESIDLPKSALIQLSELDLNPIVREDRENAGKGIPVRIGVDRQLPDITIDRGELQFTDAGEFTWRIAIFSPGAKKMRVHIKQVDLKPEESIAISSDPAEVSIYTNRGPFGTGEFWSWSISGETVLIEWQGPADHIENETGIPFAIDTICHAYRDPLNEKNSPGPLPEGNCHNDATCDTSYRALRDASAYIEFNDSGWYICSGTMLNNLNQDFAPYFITANHCISTNTVAHTVQVYFYYHTTVCNSGSASYGGSKNGANLLAHGSTQTQSDFSFLELTSTGFTGVYFSGWDRSSLSGNEAIASIHHPDGAYKRISYGKVTNSETNFWETTWNRTSNPGVTEPGSSGGGLFRDSNHRFVGQLYGGSSECGGGQNYPDYYGRFDRSFTLGSLSGWLGNLTSIDGIYNNATQPTPTPTPTSVDTPPPSATPTPTMTETSVATNTPVSETSTPTPSCEGPGCSIDMPSDHFIAGSPFYCNVALCNPQSAAFSNIPLFVVLEISGQYFFAPGFSSFDYYVITLEPGEGSLPVISPFVWLANVGSGTAQLFAAMTNPGITQVFGLYDSFSFSWN